MICSEVKIIFMVLFSVHTWPKKYAWSYDHTDLKRNHNTNYDYTYISHYIDI